MNDAEKKETEGVAAQDAQDQAAIEATILPPTDPALDAAQTVEVQQETQRWWIKLVLQPAIFLALGVLLIVALGVAQRYDFVPTIIEAWGKQSTSGNKNVQYICPMMCTPPQSEPGRCPVCAMELVEAKSGGARIDAATRRVANIQTERVMLMPMIRTIRAIGELSYDEGTLKTISAYVDGRLDRLYADYTGVVVKKDDHLALVYSPRLYSSQVEFLLAKKARQESRNATIARVIQSNRDLYESSKQRLIELGMTKLQIEQLEKAGKANSRLHLCAPSSGTVIKKLAVEGQYVKEGQEIYQLADLSNVWLMLELFPEDAADIRIDQEVAAEVQSLPGQKFMGRVAFIDPTVDPKTRTVGVRVVISNPEGQLRVGDYAKASVDIPLSGLTTANPNGEALVVPRNAVLMAGDCSAVYVESTKTIGHFEFRPVVLGPTCGDKIVILQGVKEGEQVATRGNFLLDSATQMAGLPSLIDPTKAKPKMAEDNEEKMIAALSKLSKEDRGLVENQRICPVTMMALGSMGTPLKVDVKGKPIFICCEGCRNSLLEDPETYLAKLTTAAKETGGNTPAMDLPPMGAPEIVEPQGNLPPIAVPQLIEEPQTTKPSSKRVAGEQGEIVR